MRVPELLKIPGKILGPWRSYPPGSIERAKSFGIDIMSAAEQVETTVEMWSAKLDLLDKERPWETLGIASKGDFIKAVTGRTDAEVRRVLVERAKANPLAEHGEVGNGRGRDSDATSTGRGSEYLLARLARDADKCPKAADILAAFEAGKYPSVRQAAIAAGIVRVPSQLDVLRKAWRKASDDERGEFLDWLQANA